MQKQYDKSIPIRTREVLRYMGSRGSSDPESTDPLLMDKISRCESALQEISAPRAIWKRFPLHVADEGSLEIGGIRMESLALYRNLMGCREAFLMAATIGPGVDLLIRRASIGSITESVIYQAAGAEMIESYCDIINGNLREDVLREGLYLRPRFSPGYGDLPLTLQPEIISVLDAEREIGLHLTRSLVMAPSKSVTAIIGITGEPQKNHLKDCSTCDSTDCAFRHD